MSDPSSVASPGGTKGGSVSLLAKLIAEFARALQCPSPFLSASAQLYTVASVHGWGKQDKTSVWAVLE